MRNYWLRIFIGAFAIFAIGMIGVTVVRHGMANVGRVMTSSDPITIPLSLVPFVLEGERLGKLEHLVLLREAPREVRSVELEIDLADSLVAAGLGECRLAANFESEPGQPGVQVRTSREEPNAFRCLAGDSVPPELVEFGEAVFQPGEVRVPLYVHEELVRELHEALAGDSTSALAEAQAESLAGLAALKSDSAVQATIRSADSLRQAGRRAGESLGRTGRRLGDSLRAAALRQADSARAQARRMADSAPKE